LERRTVLIRKMAKNRLKWAGLVERMGDEKLMKISDAEIVEG